MATNWKMFEKEPLIEPSENRRRTRRTLPWPAHLDQPSTSSFIEPTPYPDFPRGASVTAQAPESLASTALLEDSCRYQTWPRIRRTPLPSPRRGSLPARLATDQYPESILSSHSLEITGSSNLADITDATAMYQYRSWEPIESALDSETRVLLEDEEEKRQFTRSIYAMCLCAVLIFIICGFVTAFALNELSDSNSTVSEERASVTMASVTDHEIGS